MRSHKEDNMAWNRGTIDWMEEWNQEELMVATQVFGLKTGDAIYLLERIGEKTAEYLIECMMQRNWIGPTMVIYLDENDMDEDYFRNEKHPVFGYCRHLETGMSVIGMYKHDLLVLSHELTHAMIAHKGLKQTNAHDNVFWALHQVMNDELMALMGRG